MIHGNYVSSDGYSEPGYIAAVPGLHGELRFCFRPMLIEERGRFLNAHQKLRYDAQDRNVAALIAARVKEWDWKDAKGEGVPIAAQEVVRHMKASMVNKLFGIVLGTDPSDIDPLWEDAAKQEQAEAEAEAVLREMNVGEVKAENNEKN